MLKTFFLVQAVAREYLLLGEIGSLTGYGGVAALGDAEWYDGRVDCRRSVVKMRNGLFDFVGVAGLWWYVWLRSEAE